MEEKPKITFEQFTNLLKETMNEVKKKYSAVNIPTHVYNELGQQILKEKHGKIGKKEVASFLLNFESEYDAAIQEYIKKQMEQEDSFLTFCSSYIEKNFISTRKPSVAMEQFQQFLHFFDSFDIALSSEQCFSLVRKNSWVSNTIGILARNKKEQIITQPLNTLFDEEMVPFIDCYCIEHNIKPFYEEETSFESNENRLLTREEECELAKRIQNGDKEAERIFIEHNIRLVKKFAYSPKFIGRGLSSEDLFQEGIIGLIRGIRKFDYTKGYKFSTYGSLWIIQAIMRAINNHGKIIRIPVYKTEEYNKFNDAYSRLEMTLERTPTLEDLMKETKLPKFEIEEFLSFREQGNIISLNKSIGDDDDSELGDLIVDETTTTDIISDRTKKEAIRRYFELANLTDKEKDILDKRYGLTDGVEKTLEEVGKTYHITRERTRQIEMKAFRKLRYSKYAKEFADYMDDPILACKFLIEQRKPQKEEKEEKKQENHLDKINSYFPVRPSFFGFLKEYSEEEIIKAVSLLSPRAKRVLFLCYESDFSAINRPENLMRSEYYEIHSKLLPEIRSILEEHYPNRREKYFVPFPKKRKPSNKTIYDFFSEYPKDAVDLVLKENMDDEAFVERYQVDSSIDLNRASFSFAVAHDFYGRLLPQMALKLEEMSSKKQQRNVSNESIYDLFPTYSKEQIDFVLSRLDYEDHDLLAIVYGILPPQVRRKEKTSEEYQTFVKEIVPRMEKMLRNMNLKYMSEREVEIYFYRNKERTYSLYQRFPSYPPEMIREAVLYLSIVDQKKLQRYCYGSIAELSITRIEREDLEKTVFPYLQVILLELLIEKERNQEMQMAYIGKKYSKKR